MLQDINEISDGKIYGAQDMARVGCSDCASCHSCCEQMGDTIFLDPYDVFRLTTALGQTFEELLNGALELHVETGVIVPNLKMREADSQCYFLNEQGRCTIHAHRPGLCRVFPLGRIYEEDGISYFLQKDGCKKDNRTKVKVSKWLDTPELKRYHRFLVDWHSAKKQIEEMVTAGEDVRQINLLLLNLFFVKPYEAEHDFYEQFYERFAQFGQVMGTGHK